MVGLKGAGHFKRNLAVAFLVLMGGAAFVGWRYWFGVRSALPTTPPAKISAGHRFYGTRFPRAEKPISEGGNWKVSGGDFADVETIPGVAIGTQTGDRSGQSKYDDSTALLTGDWGPDQFVQIVVHHSGAETDADYDEAEIRLRSEISSTSNTGYEINCRVGSLGKGYIQVGKINGPLGDFTGPFNEKWGLNYLCRDGDVIVATIVGTTIKAYINGEQVLEANDASFATGAPGIGFYHEGKQAQNKDFGISSFVAYDFIPTDWQPSSSIRSRLQHSVRFVGVCVIRLRDWLIKHLG